jgi:hypothetical protein
VTRSTVQRHWVSAALVLASCAVLIFGTSATLPAATDAYDVVVVGAGPGGISAAIQAASMGSKVALVEASDWLGGQVTAAAFGTMNEGSSATRAYGVYGDFARRVTRYYEDRHKTPHTCYYSPASLCVDPVAGEHVLQSMIEPHSTIDVFLRTQVAAVTKQGSAVTGVVTSTGRRFRANVVIDATELGDVLPLAGAEYRLGTGTSSAPDASSCISDFTYTAIIKRYPGGTPKDLRLAHAPPGYSEQVARSFGSYVQAHGSSVDQGLHLPLNFSSFVAYRGLPDTSSTSDAISRSTINLPNDVHTTTRFVDDTTFRAKTICAAKLRTLQFLYYVQHDLGHKDWSIANDTGFDRDKDAVAHRHCEMLNGFETIERYFPAEPIVREGRRVVGVETLTGRDIERNPTMHIAAREFDDSIAVGYFLSDLHGCGTANSLETRLDPVSLLSAPRTMGPFEVPLGALVPAHTDGLLVAEGSVSASRIAASAVRQQPVAFSIGQAAGALASLAAKAHVAPRAVSASHVRQVLSSAHAQIDVVVR